MVEAKKPGLDGLKDWVIDNLISRGVGFVVRIIMIALFLLAIVADIIISGLMIAFWLLMPVIVGVSFIYIFIE